MKRAIIALALGYVVIGLITRAMEGIGVYRCECDADCWCKRPGLSLFRWVLPRWHKDEQLRTSKMQLDRE
jgi:hypothetical protein